MDIHMRIMTRVVRASAIAAVAGGLMSAPASLPAQDVAIRNATIITIANGDIPNGTIVVRDGKISAVGANVTVPAGVRVIDGTGKFVMPGIIDAHSHGALEGGINEGSESVTPEVQVQVMNDAPMIYRSLAGGVTAAHLMHGSANTIGGQGRVIKMRWGASAEDLLFTGAFRIVKFALGENVTRASSTAPADERRFPMTRMGVDFTVRYWFTKAKEYDQEWAAYRAGMRSNPNAIEPRRDLRLEALSDIMKGDLKVHSHSYRGDEILMLIRVADELGFKVHTFQHVLEGYKVADEMAKHGAMASTFADMWGYKVEAYDAIPYNMALMSQRGVVVSVNSDSDERIRRLYQEAGIGVRYGNMSVNEALKMVTLNPAMQLGVDKMVGTLERGKDGDIAVFSAHPFAAEAMVEYTIVDGKVLFDRSQAATLRKAAEKEGGPGGTR
ncbi:MAG: amidohydrolase family protein [Gemmatimonadetes bacterium]|nr:amidohydrolase family protein [Gemmatimonadota bacterium]